MFAGARRILPTEADSYRLAWSLKLSEGAAVLANLIGAFLL